MEELIKGTIGAGGAIGLIGALALLFYVVGHFFGKRKNGNGNGKSVEDIVKETISTIDGNHFHEVPEAIKEIKGDIKEIRKDFTEHRVKTAERFAKLEKHGK